jgi:hypothetical protein
VFVESFRFDKWRKLKFKIHTIQLDQMVKIKLKLLNLLALNEIEVSLLTNRGVFLSFYNFN